MDIMYGSLYNVWALQYLYLSSFIIEYKDRDFEGYVSRIILSIHIHYHPATPSEYNQFQI